MSYAKESKIGKINLVLRMKNLLRMRFAKRYAKITFDLIKKGMEGVGEETVETRDMADAFFRMLGNKLNLTERDDKPTEEEVKAAIEQLKDVGRFSLFASVSILPGGGFSLIGLELLARKLGVTRFTLVPSAFRKKGVGEKALVKKVTKTKNEPE